MQRARLRKVPAVCGSLILAGMVLAGPPHRDPLFTSSESSEIVQFWSGSDRYLVGPSQSANSRGSWQVRLTPEGSTWLWGLTRGHKTAASLLPSAPSDSSQPTPQPTTSFTLPTSLLETPSAAPRGQKATTTSTSQNRVAVVGITPSGSWDPWISKKVRHDRWQALLDARTANGSGSLLPPADRDTPDLEPEAPGPCPPDLATVFGEPPIFAKAVQPKSYTVKFDDDTIQYEDNIRLSSPRYAYYRWADGVMSGGVSLRKFDSDRLQRILDMAGCDQTQAHVMKAVSPLEGGFDSVNTYDTGFVSVGFIQFASLKEGSGSLGGVLVNYKNSAPEKFSADFHRYGVDVQSNGLLDVIDPVSGEEVTGPDANARIIHDKRLIAVFQRAGQLSDQFCAAQIKVAMEQYYPASDSVTFKNGDGNNLTCKVSDLVRCESGMAMLFDRKVNTGNIAILSRQASVVASNHHCETVSDVAKFEAEIVSGLKYRADFTQDQSLTQPSARR